MSEFSFAKVSVLICGLLLCAHANASVVIIDFEPATAPNSSSIIPTWQENGMLFEATEGFMLHTDPPIPSLGDHFADNGTAYMRDSLNTTINLTNLNGNLFSLLTIDLAEFSDFRAMFTTQVNFTGFKLDGSTVLQTFMLDGIFDSSGPLNDFETFSFRSEFNSLARVQIRSGAPGGFTNGISMDNFEIRVVPVPAAFWLFASGLIVLWRVINPRLTNAASQP